MTCARWLSAVGLLAVALAAAPGLAQAQEGSGCGGFKWPLEAERAALIRADKPSLANGGALPLNVATTLELQPLASAGLPKAPERAPKSTPAFAGPFHPRRASQTGHLQDHDLLGRLGRRPRRRRLPASQGLQRRDRVRGRAQERQVRPAFPPACAPVQRRRQRPDFGHRLARTIASLSPAPPRSPSAATVNGGNAASR